ncbi:hypothetical protein L5515_019277 [Caenorhabditis briggsae]|uniref:Uncharacterized protein n=1 Tax=Caenorhabditis briggsae TaxID=6238 RepID=A0AAE9JTM4_CAEBR|nr:hypothetical protein L5515_019277 [Caenorhabditis briggsae]
MPPHLRLTNLDYTVLPMRDQPKKRFNCTITLSLAQRFAMALAILGFITDSTSLQSSAKRQTIPLTFYFAGTLISLEQTLLTMVPVHKIYAMTQRRCLLSVLCFGVTVPDDSTNT